jgi:hypothetical protein
MSDEQVTSIKPRAWTGVMTFAVIATFVVASALGSVTTLALSAATAEGPAATAPGSSPACDATDFVSYRRLLRDMGAAAERHDIRLYVGFRNDLAHLIEQVGPQGSVQLVTAIEDSCWD